MFGSAEERGFLSRTVLIILAIGLLIRLALSPILTYPFDIEHWAVIIQNINTGNGLYNLSGYFYTPVWGYILGFETMVMDNLGGMFSMGERVTDLLPIEGLSYRYYTATTTTISFNIAMKIPLIIVDVVVGYLLWQLVMEKTDDRRKADISLMLWFFCPVVIYMSGVQAQFDCISALLALLSVLLLRKDTFLLAGVLLMAAALLKLWPAALVFVFIPYIFNRFGRQEGIRKLLMFAIGAIATAAVIYAPTIMDGSFVDSLSFILSRSSESKIYEKVFFVLIVLFAATICLFSTLYMVRNKDLTDDRLLLFSTVVLSGVTMISIGPQYCIVYLPLYIYIIVVSGDVLYRKLFIAAGIFCTISAFANNAMSLLTSLAQYTGWISPAGVADLMQSTELLFRVLQVSSVPAAISLLLICLVLFAD